MTARTHRDALGSVIGLLVFLGGVSLLLLVFRLAYDQFSVPPQTALQVQPGKAIDFAATGSSFAGVLLRILLLLVMGVVGSLISNRGITLYSHCRGDAKKEEIEKLAKQERQEKPA